MDAVKIPGWAQREAGRLDAAPALAPRTKEGCDEVLECIARNCTDAAHAHAVMTILLDTVTRCQNLTAEIARIAAETRKLPELPSGCAVCNGEPWIMVNGAAARCSCARGRALKAGLRD